MKNRSTAPMQVARMGYIILSSLLCVLGLLFFLLPENSAQALGKICAFAILAFGIVKLIGYFSRDLFRLAFQYDLEIGIILIVLGVLLLIRNEDFLNFLCVMAGIGALADGLFKIRIGTDARKFGISLWWLIQVLAVITCAAGIFLVLHPQIGTLALTMYLGICLLCEGIMNLYVVIRTVKVIKNQKPDVIDADYEEMKEEENTL